MTDKLADAKRALLKISVEADHIYSDEIEAINSFITYHEATKAATPDDVLKVETPDRYAHSPTLQATWRDGYNAALRNTQGVPREVLDALRLAAPIVWKDALNTACLLSCPTDEATAAQVAMNKALAILDQHARGG